MEKDIEKILHKGKTIALPKEKKALLRSKLSEYADFHPVRATEEVRLEGRGRHAVVSLFYQLKTKRTMPIVATLLIAVFLGGGTSYAAEGALPGDTLYPVKVAVNENVRSAITVSAEGEAEWNARLAERRLEEVEQLSAEGNIDAETEADLLTRFETHVAKSQAQTQKLSQEGEYEAALAVSSNLEARLNAHADIISSLAVADMADVSAKVAEDVPENTQEAVATFSATVAVETAEAPHAPQESILTNRVRMIAESATRARMDAENAISLRADISAEKKIKTAERAVKRVKADIEERAGETRKSEAYLRAEGRITAADALLVEARAELRAKNNGAAFRLAQEAEKLATEALIFIKNKAVLDARIESNNNTHIEGNVPVSEGAVHTDAEVLLERVDGTSTTTSDDENASSGTNGGTVDTEVNIDADIRGGGVDASTSGRVNIGL